MPLKWTKSRPASAARSSKNISQDGVAAAGQASASANASAGNPRGGSLPAGHRGDRDPRPAGVSSRTLEKRSPGTARGYQLARFFDPRWRPLGLSDGGEVGGGLTATPSNRMSLDGSSSGYFR